MLVEYVKNKKGQKIGVVVAVDRDIVGWSQCNIKKDTFDKTRAILIAEARCLTGTKMKPVGPEVPEALERIRERSHHYFKVSPEEYRKSTRPYEGLLVTNEGHWHHGPFDVYPVF